MADLATLEQTVKDAEAALAAEQTRLDRIAAKARDDAKRKNRTSYDDVADIHEARATINELKKTLAVSRARYTDATRALAQQERDRRYPDWRQEPRRRSLQADVANLEAATDTLDQAVTDAQAAVNTQAAKVDQLELQSLIGRANAKDLEKGRAALTTERRRLAEAIQARDENAQRLALLRQALPVVEQDAKRQNATALHAELITRGTQLVQRLDAIAADMAALDELQAVITAQYGVAGLAFDPSYPNQNALVLANYWKKYLTADRLAFYRELARQHGCKV